MPSKIQLGITKGGHSKGLGSHPGGGKSPLHSMLVTNTAYHTSLFLMGTLAGLD